jgi:hypothetical protein
MPTNRPAKPQDSLIIILGGTVHIGNGQVIENGAVVFNKGKITFVGAALNAPASSNAKNYSRSRQTNLSGHHCPKHRYRLNEIDAARATNDYNEVGNYNPGVRSLIAYNTDSKATPTVRSNGILLAQVVPQGGIISGTSSVMQLDAWNWEDAAYKTDDGLHLNWPSSSNSPSMITAARKP